MRTIDRYLLRQFVQTFLICFLSLTGLYVVCDLLTNLEYLLHGGEKAGSTLTFIARFYAFKTILFFDQISGPLALISAMFTVTWIQRHNEMTALMAAGISRIRILMPIVFAVAAVSLLSAANRELVIPRCRTELSRRPQDPLGDRAEGVESRYDLKTGAYLNGKSTFADHMRIAGPEFTLPPDLQDYGRRIIAENAYFIPADGSRPSGYLLEGVREPKNLASRPSLPRGGPPVLITPRDAPAWLDLKPDQCFLLSDVSFDLLTPSGSTGQLSSTAEMIRDLRTPSLTYRADKRVAIHARIVQPLLDVTLLFLGLPLVVSRESRNVFLAMGLCMVLTALFTLAVAASQHLIGELWPKPVLGAWAPLMIFVPLAVRLSDSLRR